MLIYYDNQTDMVIKERRGKISLPNGDVINCLGANPDPARSLYQYVEEGPRQAAPGKMINTVTSTDGWNYKVTRVEVDNPNFDLDAFKAQKIAKIKQQAGAVILASLPDWKQRNMNMRATELQEIRLDGRPLTTEEQAESVALKAVATWIKSVRAASGAAEAVIMDLSTAAEVEVFAITWPPAEDI